jgi:hypothetical protein
VTQRARRNARVSSWQLGENAAKICCCTQRRSMLITVAARSEAWVCSQSPARITGSNPSKGVDVCLLSILCVVRYSTVCSLIKRSPTECGCLRMMMMIMKHR